MGTKSQADGELQHPFQPDLARQITADTGFNVTRRTWERVVAARVDQYNYVTYSVISGAVMWAFLMSVNVLGIVFFVKYLCVNRGSLEFNDELSGDDTPRSSCMHRKLMFTFGVHWRRARLTQEQYHRYKAWKGRVCLRNSLLLFYVLVAVSAWFLTMWLSMYEDTWDPSRTRLNMRGMPDAAMDALQDAIPSDQRTPLESLLVFMTWLYGLCFFIFIICGCLLRACNGACLRNNEPLKEYSPVELVSPDMEDTPVPTADVPSPRQKPIADSQEHAPSSAPSTVTIV
jgi:hypothetical protein